MLLETTFAKVNCEKKNTKCLNHIYPAEHGYFKTLTAAKLKLSRAQSQQQASSLSMSKQPKRLREIIRNQEEIKKKIDVRLSGEFINIL